MRISDRYLVQGPYDGNAVVVDDMTGAEQRVSLDLADVSTMLNEIDTHPNDLPLEVGPVSIPATILPRYMFALGYMYAHAADEAWAGR